MKSKKEPKWFYLIRKPQDMRHMRIIGNELEIFANVNIKSRKVRKLIDWLLTVEEYLKSK